MPEEIAYCLDFKRFNPSFEFLVKPNSDNCTLSEEFKSNDSNNWKRFSINGNICYVSRFRYFGSDGGDNSAPSEYENYSLTKDGKFISVKGKSDMFFKQGNSENKPLEIPFESIKNKEIKKLLAGENIWPYLVLKEGFSRKNGDSYTRRTLYDRKIEVRKTDKNERYWEKDKSGKIYEIINKNQEPPNEVKEATKKVLDIVENKKNKGDLLYFLGISGKISAEDTGGNIWHINIETENFIPEYIEKKMKISEIDDKFARELLQGKHKQEFKSITAALKERL